jgi:Chlamydia polymorphic membrane protein (Chlamydia_PMP).
MKKQVTLIVLTLLFFLLACNTVSAVSENNSTQLTVITNNSNANNNYFGVENAQNIVIKGKVTKCSNGDNFSGVTVAVSKNGTKLASTTTKPDGTYSLNFQGDQTTFTVTASYPGHKSSSKTVTLINSVGTANFQLGTTDVYVSTTGNDTTGDGTKDNPYLTIQTGLNNVLEGGTVHLQAGTYTGTGNVNLNIGTDVTIVGESQTNTTINAPDSSPIFTISAKVLIANLTLTKGTDNVNSGAIYNERYAITTLSNCTFINNTAIYGGAINNRDGALNLNNCTFTDNHATYGGAINNQNGDITLNNCSFTNNTAQYGGAIYTTDGGYTVSNGCNFTNNTAGYGGAINNYESNIALRGCNFTNNSGNVIYNFYGTISTNSCNFTNNSGYAIYAKNCITALDVNNCNFINNDGGAIYNSNGDTIGTVNSCNFINNRDSALYNYYGTLNVYFCTFIKNNAYSNGGAIYNNDIATTTLDGCSFTNNTAGQGGAIYNKGNLKISGENCIFSSNHAAYGGAIYNDHPCIIYHCYFVNNTATYGGAIYNKNILNASSCSFTSNSATQCGGAIYNYGNLKAHFNSIARNSAPQGSAIYNVKKSDHVGYCDIDNNWWGSNANPSGKLCNTTVYNWLVLTVNASSALIKSGGKSGITTNLRYDNKGIYHDPANGSVPDIKVTYTTTLGTITGPQYLFNGFITSTFKAGVTGGKASILVRVDDQKVSKSITINLPLKVAATSPKNGATGVSRTSTISIRLSENILKSSNWSKIYIKNLKTGSKCKITAWISGNHLYIKTNSKKAAYTSYKVYIPASAVKDGTKNNLAASYSFKFKTGKY